MRAGGYLRLGVLDQVLSQQKSAQSFGLIPVFDLCDFLELYQPVDSISDGQVGGWVSEWVGEWAGRC